MSYPVYMVPAGDVLPIFFDTFDGGTGASITMTGLAVTDIEIYKDGGTTQRASDAGYTLLDTDGIDFDGLTGIHGFSIDTGDNTDAGFYTVGAWFHVVVSAITIDAQTVSFVAAAFRIMKAESVAGVPKSDVDAWLGTGCATPTVNGVPEVDLTHVAGSTTNVSALATNVDAILTDTASIDTAGEIAAAVWNADATTYQTAGSFGQAIGDPGANAATIYDAVVTNAAGTDIAADIIAMKVDTAAILVDTGTTLDGRIPAALVSGRMDVSVGAVAAGAITAAAIATDAIDADALATDAVTEIKNAVADQVWDENITGHTAAFSAGATLQPSHSGACQAGGNTTTVVLASAASSTDDYYNGDLIFGWVTADRTNFFSDYITDYVGATRTATVTGIAVSPDATYTYVVMPGGTIPGATAPSAADVADAVWDEAFSGHVTEGSFGNVVGGEVSHEGTLQSAASTTSVVFDATGPANHATNDVYNYCRFEIVAGTGIGQASYVTDYVGSSKTATLAPALAVQPDNTSRYIVRKLGLDAATREQVAAAVWDMTRSGHATAGTFGEYVFADVSRISTDATAADNMEAFFDGTGYAGTNNVIPSVTTVTGNVNGSVASVTAGVTLADGAHGGSSAVITAKRVVVANTTNGQTAVDISSSGTGNAHALNILASGAGKGVAIGAASVGLSIDSSAADAVTIQGGTNSDGIQIAGNGSGVDINADITGNLTGNVSGSVGSVTGAVGSVTGNVSGSVASVVANVNADVKKINGTTVAGDGGTTPWGP